jgi:spore germination protein
MFIRGWMPLRRQAPPDPGPQRPGAPVPPGIPGSPPPRTRCAPSPRRRPTRGTPAAPGTPGTPGTAVSRARAGVAAAALLAALLSAPAALAAGTPGGAPTPAPAAPAGGASSPAQATFTDVAGSWAEADIHTLLASGVLHVPADGRFRPDDPVDRLDFAVWMARAQELAPLSGAPTPAPTDWSSVPEADRPYVSAVIRAGYLRGFPDGSFQPGGTLSRAQMAVVFGRILEGYGERPDPRVLEQFADFRRIPAWAAAAAIPVQDGLLYGEPYGSQRIFAASQPTTRAETAGFIVRFLRYRTQQYHGLPLGQPSPQPSPSPGPGLQPPPGGPAGFLTGFWYTNTDEAYQNLLAHGSQLNWLVYTGYSIEADGKIKGYDSPRTIAWVRAHPMPFYVMFQNDWPDDGFLHDPAAEADAVQNLLYVARRAGYTGVNLDIEGIPPSDRAAFTAFVASASAALHAQGFRLSVDVPSETRDDPQSSWAGAYDYRALSPLVDNLILMTYDYHSSESEPGPISPISWVQRVLAYTTSVVPASKVVMGLPAYGWLWSSAGGATAYWESGMEKKALEHGVAPQYDASQAEATFTYAAGGLTYTGWFVNPQGLEARLQLARADGLAGVLAWRLSYDTPDWWPLLAGAARLAAAGS